MRKFFHMPAFIFMTFCFHENLFSRDNIAIYFKLNYYDEL